MKCPKCDKVFYEPSGVSRRDNKTKICLSCSIGEMIFDLSNKKSEKVKGGKVHLLKELIERIENHKSNMIHIIAVMSPEEWNTLKEAVQFYC